MITFKKAFFTISMMVFCSQLFAETKTDSLHAILSLAKTDSTKLDSLNDFFRTRINGLLEPDSMIKYGKEALSYSQSINFPRGIALAYKSIGIGYYRSTEYVEALNNWMNSLAAFDSIHDKNGIANMNSNIGAIYFDQGADETANKFYFNALKSAEEIGDSLRIATACMNIGAVYGNKPLTYSPALEYYERALALCEQLEYIEGVGTVTVGMGEIYYKRKIYEKALFYFEKSLKAYEGTSSVPYTLYNLGLVYMQKGDFGKALNFEDQALEMAIKYDSKLDITYSLIGHGDIYTKKGDAKLALTNYKQAERLALESKLDYRLEEIYKGLSENYATLSDFQNAFRYQSALIDIKKKIYDLETDKKLGSIQFTYTLDKKESEIGLLNKDKVIQQQEISRQKLMRNGFIGGFAVVLLFASVFFKQRNRISKEKKRSDELLLNILPSETAEELKATGTAKTKSFSLVSVMFTDFKNFTQASEKLTPEELVDEINLCYSEFDRIISKYGIEKIKTIGDSYMCAGGLPVSNETHPVDVINAGLEMQQFINKIKAERISKDLPFFELRLGIHTGPVVAGIVGLKKFAYDIWGDTVNTASRMESSGQVGKVNISGTTYDLIKGKFKCEHRGKIEAKNKGTIDMYFVEGVA